MNKLNEPAQLQAEDEAQVQFAHALQTAADEVQLASAAKSEMPPHPAGEPLNNPPAHRTAAAMIFSPANALMNRLDVSWKFAALGLMSLVAIAVVMYSLFASLNLVIRTSQRQLEGIALIKPFSRTVQILQQHRGISNGLLSGNEAMREWRIDREKEAVEALQAMDEKLSPSLVSSEDFRHIKADWGLIRKEGLNWAAAENFSAHTHLINDLRIFQVAAADEFELTHAPEIGAFYLINTVINKLPSALESLAQIRGYGTGILARKQATERQKVEMNTLVAELDDTLESLRINIEKTYHYNPAVQNSISTASRDVTDSAQQIIDIVKSDIVTGHFTTSPDDFFKMTSVAVDDGYAQLYDSLVPMSEALIKARIARAENTLRTSVGIALLLFLVVVYFSMGICYTIVGNIRSLARSSRAFAGGNLRERINLNTHDEFSKVGDSFNEMADGFSAMLEARHEDEARLRATIETAMDAVVRMNAKGLITGWNGQAEKVFGWPPDEALGRVMSETIIPPQYREAHVRGLKHFLLSGENTILNSRIEITGLHRNGHEFPIELSIAPIRMAGNVEFSAFIRDITERKTAEEKIQRLTQLYAALSQCNVAIVHCVNEEELFQKICRSVVQFGGMKMAWIGLLDEASQRVNPVSSCGEGAEYLEDMGADDLSGHSPVVAAIHEDQPIWRQDFLNDPSTALEHEHGVRSNWAAAASLPLHKKGVAIGAFTLYADEANAFDEAARNLLTEMAMDISFALDNFAHKADVKLAEAQLLESETRYKRITEGLTDYQYTVRVENGHAVDTVQSLGCATVTGYTEEEFAADPYLWIRLVAPEDRDKVNEHVQQILAGKDIPPIEYRILHKDGEARWVSDTTILFKDASGNLQSYDGVIKDITERKTTEEHIQRYITQLESAFMRTVEVTVSLTEMRDPYTAGHERRVAEVAAAIGGELGWDARRIEGLRVAGQLHDSGKISLPAEILAKPSRISAAEYTLIKEHPQSGYDALKDVGFPWPVAEVAWQHHERMDGSGYPRGLKGDEILLEARIMSVADVVEAMASHRPYRPGHGIDKALAEIERGSGTAYDPAVAEACLRLFREKGYVLPS